MTRINWTKCGGGVWCSLARLKLETVHCHGVYVIWHGGQSPHVVYVGQGDVAKRLADHRDDRKITRHSSKGDLFVTWAAVQIADRDGIERYLADKYSPLEGESHPAAVPVAVNSPWD